MPLFALLLKQYCQFLHKLKGLIEVHVSTILIVDDEQSMLITLEDILKMQGYTVITAEDGYQTIELVKKIR